jgi:dipeptidase D
LQLDLALAHLLKFDELYKKDMIQKRTLGSHLEGIVNKYSLYRIDNICQGAYGAFDSKRHNLTTQKDALQALTSLPEPPNQENDMSIHTKKILGYFEKLNKIPRCSGNEAQVCKWLQQWADGLGYESQVDAGGNLVVRVPAADGHHTDPILILQGHMDMVCEKTPESKHDFSRDPIRSHMDQNWLTADETTQGADNGIAIAYMMTLAEKTDLVRPALELLFTVDEESGLNGAKLLQPDFVKGKALINLDSEDEGIFTIGCAGGVDTTLTRKMAFEPVPAGDQALCLRIGGLKGGHSGIDIDKHRANANKILARALERIRSTCVLRIGSLEGGTRHNAIPRDAKATVLIPSSETETVQEAVKSTESLVRTEYAATDPGIFIRLNKIEDGDKILKALTALDTKHAIQMLLALPSGVAAMSSEFEGAVETSSNLATVNLVDEQLSILVSQRSAVTSRLEGIRSSVHSLAALSGAGVQDANAYPPWQPNTESCVLKKSKAVYRRVFGRSPEIQVIHAGLECAVIGDIYSGMDMISIGPTIENPHAPGERLLVPSVESVWKFLIATIEELATAC